jgi:membrane-associated phospholipid phosphatase
VTATPATGVTTRGRDRLRRAAPWAIGLALLAVAVAIDPWAYHHVVLRNVYDFDWGRALRTMGYWPVWAAVSLALWLHDRGRGAAGYSSARRAMRLIASASIAGVIAELLKLVVRRERPSLHDGAYGFRAWSDRPLSSSGFGFPSSHAVEAFAAAAVLGQLFPESRALWWALAVGCGLTRIMAGAHFVSDVVAGALLGALTATLLARSEPHATA